MERKDNIVKVIDGDRAPSVDGRWLAKVMDSTLRKVPAVLLQLKAMRSS